MGLYYDPVAANTPNIGAAQPLEGRKLTPSSGPAPQNPPFRGTSIGREILGCWAAVVLAAAVLPQVAINLNPPISGPTAQNPPFTGGARVSSEILAGWIPPAPATVTARLIVPISGPAVSNPPPTGPRVSADILSWWIPPPPQAPVASNLSPSILTSTLYVPTFVSALQSSVIADPPQPPVSRLLTPISGPAPQNPPFIGSRVPVEIQNCWAAAPTPLQPNNTGIAATSRLHVQGNFVTNTAFVAGTSIAVTLTSPIGGRNLVCGSLTWGSASNVLSSITDDKGNVYNVVDVVADGADAQSYASFYLSGVTGAPQTITANFSSSVNFRGMIADEYLGSSFSGIDGHAAQLLTAPGTGTDALTSGSITTTKDGDLIYGIGAPASVITTVAAGTGFQLEQISSVSTAPLDSEDKIQAVHGAVAGTFTLAASGRSVAMVMAFAPPTNPPFVGARVANEILSWWSQASPAPIVASSFIPPTPAAGFVPVGAQVPRAVLASWDAPVPAPIVADYIPIPISGPTPQSPPLNGGAQVSQSVLIAWIPPAPPAPAAVNLNPLLIAGPPIQNPPFVGGAQFPLAGQICWIPPGPQAPTARLLNPPASGPAPQNPPLSGGARVGYEILNWWIPLPPAPIVALNLNPPVSGPAAFPFPGSVIPAAVHVWWAPQAPQPQQGTLAVPTSPAAFPFLGTAVSQSVLAWWGDQAPPPQPRTLLVPAPPAGSSFPLRGASIPPGTLQWWGVDSPVPAAAKLAPPISGPTPQNPPLIPAEWSRQVYAVWSWPSSQNYQPFAAGIMATITGPGVSNPKYIVGYSKIPIRKLP